MNKKQLIIPYFQRWLSVCVVLFFLKSDGKRSSNKNQSSMKSGAKRIFTSFKESELTSLKFEDQLRYILNSSQKVKLGCYE